MGRALLHSSSKSRGTCKQLSAQGTQYPLVGYHKQQRTIAENK